MGLLKIAAVGAIAWIGYVIYKNKSVPAGMAQLQNELTTAQNTISGLVSSAKSMTSNSATPAATPATTIAVTATLPQAQATGSFTNFVGQPYWVAELSPQITGAMEQHYDASYGATMSPTPITIYE